MFSYASASTPDIVPPLFDRDMPGRIWAATKFVLKFILLQLLLGAVVVVIGLFLFTAGEPTLTSLATEFQHASTPLLTLMAGSELGVLMFAVMRAAGFGFENVGLRWNGAGRSLAMLAPLVAVLAAVFWTDPNISLGDALSSELLPIAIVFACLVGLTEELVFRGLVVGALGGSAAPVLSILGSATLFALVHFAAPDGQLQRNVLLAMFTIFGLFGVPFAVVYLRSGSILGLVLVHAVWDALVIAGQGLEAPSGSAGAVDWLVPAAVAAGYGGWFFATRTRRVVARRPIPRRRQAVLVDWATFEDELYAPLAHPKLRRIEVAAGGGEPRP